MKNNMEPGKDIQGMICTQGVLTKPRTEKSLSSTCMKNVVRKEVENLSFLLHCFPFYH